MVSGGAYGIDGAAHRATLATDGFTVAVLAGGIDMPIPRRPCRAAASDRAAGPGRQRVSAGCASGAPSISDPQPAGRRVVGCHGGRRGGCPQRRGEHRRVGAGAGSSGVCSARTGHVVGVGRVAMRCCAAAQTSSPAPPMSSSSSVASVNSRRTRSGPAQRSTVSVRPSSGSTRRCPPAAAAPPTRSPIASGLAPTQVLGPLSMLEVCGLVTREERLLEAQQATVARPGIEPLLV